MTIAALEQLLDSGVTGEVRVPITRKALPALFASRGYTSGAEIGVWHGGFASKLCAVNPSLKLICVDAWESFHGYVDSKGAALKTRQQMVHAERTARAELARFSCDIRKGISVDVARTVPDRSLDFVYIDGDHSYDGALLDLRVWTPKVKRGGVIAGHDYCVNPAKPFIDVIGAVKTFVADAGIARWHVLAGERTPSFYWVNP